MNTAWLANIFGSKPAPAPEPPIRAELFSVERLEQHAESLAAAQHVIPGGGKGRPISPRLTDNARILIATYKAIVSATYARQPITPAAEWLLDNFHVVDEQIREIKDDLPPGYYRRLPKLADGPLQGYPRVFGVAWALVAHTDSAFDVQKLTRFVEAYQRVQPLTIGELWAIAITLRITLVENLRRLAESIVARLAAGQLADDIADRSLGTEKSDPEPEQAILQRLNQAPWSTAFAVQLAQRLRDRDPNTTPALRWLNDRLHAERTTVEQTVREEVQRQSAMNVTVRNVITSMRMISMVNWAEFFESVSPVDAILRGGSDFAAMDFPTRDMYRRAIEEMALFSGKTEPDIAKKVIGKVQRAADPRGRDPGYYLIAQGRADLEKELGCRVKFGTRLFRLNSRLGVISYVGMIVAVTATIVALALLAVAQHDLPGWTLVLLAFTGIVPASDVAVAVVNRIITQRIGAMLLPGMALRDGVPADLRSIVVMPTLLTSIATIEEHVERLEVHHLSNPDENFVFALLSDWADSDTEHAPNDETLLHTASAAIARLNERYGAAGNSPRFYLLHRRRLWNEGEQKWIGWERKRGKLHELNRLLRGATDTSFLPVNGQDQALPGGLKYVITLDADTRLPIGAARRLVGKMAHPLNRPLFDRDRGRVTQGHGILQPRVTPSLPASSKGSLFQRVFSGPNGLDPYALAVSDVYQDLFEEGSYCGKGIYDVDIFEAALKGQIPESTVLSHDLLEGTFTRAGLATDIEVVEEFPSKYSVAAARQHRWVRGDWQLLPWIFALPAKPRDGEQATSIPFMGRWKMLDNLRRSLSAPAAMLALLVGWFQKYHAAEIWTVFILLTIALPPLLPVIASIIPRRTGVTLRNHVRALREDFVLGVLQSAFLLTFLAHQAWMMVDAVARTLFRVFIRRRRLLEWVTAAQVNENSNFDNRTLAMQMFASAVFAVLVAVALYYSHWHGWKISVPFGVLWMLSPILARWASEPPPDGGHVPVTKADAASLRTIARRTWRFFETFVTAEDNMLPPDNFQEIPTPVVAHRTSPTNIGLYLLSIIAARDFGWIGTLDMVDRLEATFATLDKMERQRGHFFNWYDTSDLRPLEPRYISSVDSGNLAGHLIVVGNACLEAAASPIHNTSWISGLEDSLALARDALSTDKTKPLPALTSALDAFSDALGNARKRTAGIVFDLAAIAQKSDAVVAAVQGSTNDDLVTWAHAMRQSVAAIQRDIDLLVPWLAVPEARLKDGDLARLLTVPMLNTLSAHCKDLHGEKPHAVFSEALEKSESAAQLLVHRLASVAEKAKSMANGMEFGFMFDKGRQLLSIGYRCSDGSLDPNYYDLLASEARLASFFAIAKGDVLAEHWFHLGRTLTPIAGGSGLISWSGSMFEYLMPALVMRAPSGSLLEETNRLIVKRQESYGDELGVPWGISESEFNARDMEQTYQYSSFGVPDLGFKRGLGDNTVIAPYATGLAAMVDPDSAERNYQRMAKMGVRGAYGWYEAIDFTRARVPEGSKYAIIRAYMSHHQGMSIVGIANALHDGRMRERFHAEPMIQAAELLLQERMPRDIAMARPAPQQDIPRHIENIAPEIQRRYDTPHSRAPRSHLMSNGRYAVMVTATGSGYSRWRDVAITRWREDVTCDGWGSYIFLRDVKSGETWSAGYQPSIVEPDSYDVAFSEDRAEIVRNDGSLTTTLEISISPEDDAEVRRVSITNHGNRTREIDVTSYAEMVLARQGDDIAHPAFAKLFVQTEFVPHLGAILATRRQRSSADPQIWVAHLAVVEGENPGDVQFETDRARFLSRGQTIQTSTAISDGWPLSNTAGAVLDPIFSLRRRIQVPRGATIRIAFWTLAAATRADILDLADRHNDPNAFERSTTLAWTQAQMQLRHLGISMDDAHLFQRLANHVLYSDPTLRPPSDVIKRGLAKASSLWSQGISGDLPIILVRIEEDDDLGLVRQVLRAHEYGRLKQLAADLVILNERATSYAQDFQGEVDRLVRMNQSLPHIEAEEARGGVFVLRADLVPPDVRDLLFACARVVLQGSRGSLEDQINRAREKKPGKPPPARPALPAPAPEAALPLPQMEYFNGLGGFTDNGREFLTILERGERTPAPWINVIANPNFGFQVSTDGSGFCWAINSQQNQITPWSNDQTGDPPGEVLYLRDEDTGEVWTPTALPIREKTSTYTARHGQGYSRFTHVSHGIALELLEYVPIDDSLKIARLRIANQSGRDRRLSVTAFVEWVLGTNRSASAPYVVTEIDSATGAIFAQNPWSEEFGQRISFMDLKGRQTAWTCDRTEFVGREGTLERPLALTPGATLSNRVGAGLDPCGALQALVRLSAVGTTEIVFFLGQCANRADAQALIAKYRNADLDAVFGEVTQQWDNVLDTVQVKTPDRALDILLNRWLVYQALSCRVWARTGFYQASGAYGFRDQLQDVMALCVSRPDIAREHLLRAAGRQFVEGDVQHWWLPESGRGIRTRVSDDCGWLAYVAAHYVQTTGDNAVLDEMIPFLEGAVLREGEHDSFFQPKISDKKASLFDHCALALDHSLKTGAHGLPLMGAGDWNDGMDKVGEGGKGESVWLGWFLCSALNAFANIAERRKADEHAHDWRQHVESLKEALEREAWDGDWYRRAFFDDGTPLGSVANTECRIDSIAQSWSVISRSAEPARAERALAALDKYLVRRDDKLSLLFTPPFDHPAQDPGYIKGYPPGIRENGGQYTHGATWAAMAFAIQGDGDRAGELMAMLNPIHHADTPNAVQRYKVEPYIACADVYSVPPHAGRGGWTWYTGSAAWTYRVALEWILGFRQQGSNLVIDPCIPRNWPSFEIVFKYRTARYEISVENPLGVCRGILAIKLDGEMLKGNAKLMLPLADDGATHKVQVVLG